MLARSHLSAPRRSLLLLATSVVLACSGDSGTTPDATVASVMVTPDTHTFIGREGTIELSVSLTGSDGGTLTGIPVGWVSSEPGVAVVSGTGVVTAVAAGRTTVTATAGGESGSATIDVGQVVGTGGGTVSSADGAVRLIVPGGALASDAHVTLDEPTDLPGVPGEIPGSAVQVGPASLAFQGEVELLLRYPPLPSGTSPLSLRAFRLESGEWAKVATSLPEPDEGHVRSSVARAGVYALLVDRLGSEATSMLAGFLTARGAAGSLLPLAGHKPRDLDLDDQALIDALGEELGPGRVAVATVDPAAYDRVPPRVDPEDLEIRIFGGADLSSETGAPRPVAEPDAQIGAGVKAILDLMRTLDGFDLPEGQLSDMELAWRDTEFHEEGEQAGGIMVPDDADALSFPLGLTDQFGMFTVGYSIVVVYDGHSHVVFTEEDAQELRDGEIVDSDGTLSETGRTALHEMIHVTLKLRGREDKDDADDLVVAALEVALAAKINLELDRKANGEADPGKVSAYSTAVGRVVELGAGDCLHLFGLPAAAGTLTVMIPASVQADGTFRVSVTVLGADGVPLVGEDVYVNQSHFDEDNEPVFGVGDPDRPDPEVLQTDVGGDAGLDVKATSTPGRVNIRVQAGGKTFTGSVTVTPMQTAVRIRAVANPPITSYTIHPGTPQGAESFAWSGANCGSVTGSTTSAMAWNHGEEDCDHTSTEHLDATISLLIIGTTGSGEPFELRCTYVGAASGDGPDCVSESSVRSFGGSTDGGVGRRAEGRWERGAGASWPARRHARTPGPSPR